MCRITHAAIAEFVGGTRKQATSVGMFNINLEKKNNAFFFLQVALLIVLPHNQLMGTSTSTTTTATVQRHPGVRLSLPYSTHNAALLGVRLEGTDVTQNHTRTLNTTPG